MRLGRLREMQDCPVFLLSLQPSWLLIYPPNDILKWKTNLQIIYNK